MSARARSSSPKGEATQSLWDLLAELKSHRMIDLTHAFRPGIPRWPGVDDEVRTTLYHYDEGIGTKGGGFLTHEYRFSGAWGTHLDAPAHFVRGKRFVDEITPGEMLLPLVVLDISRQTVEDHDYQVGMGDVRAWERRHGLIPAASFAALRTDWSRNWPDPKAMANRDKDGVEHYPGWSLEVLTYLFEERGVTAVGHEVLNTDPGFAASRGDFSLETYVLSRDRYQIELLANLDQVPEQGAVVIATVPKPYRGTSFPARVIAIVP